MKGKQKMKTPNKKVNSKVKIKKSLKYKKNTKKPSTTKINIQKEPFLKKRKIDAVAKELYKKRVTEKHLVKTKHLTIILLTCIIAVIITTTVLFKSPNIKKKVVKPHQLSTIDNEKIFSEIKTSLFKEVSEEIDIQDSCTPAIFSNKEYKKYGYVQNKFLIILKRGKLFVVNNTNNKFINSLEISPYPIKEKNAIHYYNVLIKENTIMVVGYRTATETVELSIFSINQFGKIERNKTYNLNSDPCNFAINLNNNHLIIYTTKKLSSDTLLNNIKSFNNWNNKSNIFTNEPIKTNKILYDNNSFLENPLIHTITTCQLNGTILTDCQQSYLLDNASLATYINDDAFYFWTTQLPLKNNPFRITPTSKLYTFNFNNNSFFMNQIEGIPISKKALFIKNNLFFAQLYQNNDTPPLWHEMFTSSKIAHLKLETSKIQPANKFINNPKDYILTNYNFNEIKNTTINNNISNFITTDYKNSSITLYNLNKKIIIPVDGEILNTIMLSEENIFLYFYQKDNVIFAQIFNTLTMSPSSKISLKINFHNPTKVIPSKINFFKLQNKKLISISFVNTSLNKGSSHLLNLKNNTLTEIYTLPLTKQQQYLNDHCQNDCQEDWQVLNNFFILPQDISTTPTIYATTGSLLKKFTFNKNDKLSLIKSINYTHKPIIVKRRPRARIPGGAKRINGKYVCGKKHGYVGKSKKNNKGYLHLDLECCLDPDEYPNPWCAYKPGELSVTNLRYKDYHGKVRRKKRKKH